MKFLIKRTSVKKVKPCKRAVIEEYEYTDWSLTHDENGNFITQFNPRIGKRWIVEVNTLDELINLCKEENQDLIISVGSDGPCIEIYDMYRE